MRRSGHRFCRIAALIAIFGAVVTLTTVTTFAKNGNPSASSGPCSGYSSKCWSGYNSNAGGMVWIRYNGPKIDNFQSIQGMLTPSGATYNGKQQTQACDDGQGVYFLAALWHWNGGGPTGEIWGPQAQNEYTDWANNTVNADPELAALIQSNLGTGFEVITMDHLTETEKSVTWDDGVPRNDNDKINLAMESRFHGDRSGGNTSSGNWENLSWFCGDLVIGECDDWEERGYSSRLCCDTDNGDPSCVDPCEDWEEQGYISRLCCDTNNGDPSCQELDECPLPYAINPGVGSDTRGTAIFFSGIRSTVYTEYDHTVYAKPSDKFNWAHCYYREEQEVNFTWNRDDCPMGGTGALTDDDNAVDQCHHTYEKTLGTYHEWSHIDGHPIQPTNDPVPNHDLYLVDDEITYSGINNNKGRVVTICDSRIPTIARIIDDCNHLASQYDAINDYNGDEITKILNRNISFGFIELHQGADNLRVSSSGDVTGIKTRGSHAVGETFNDSIAIFSANGSQSAPTYNVDWGHAGVVNTQKIKTDAEGTNEVRVHQSYDYWSAYYFWCHVSCSCMCSCGRNCSRPCHHSADHYSDCDSAPAVVGLVHGIHDKEVYIHSIGTKTHVNEDASRASAYVPYNFQTSTSTYITQTITDAASQNEVVMANEQVTVTASAAVLPKGNEKTQGNYATETDPQGKIRWVSFYLPEGGTIPTGGKEIDTTDPCTYFAGVLDCKDLNSVYTSDTDDQITTDKRHYNAHILNPGDATHNNTTGVNYTYSASFKIHNVPAGYKFCTAIGIYPTDSGDDDNKVTGDANGYFQGTPQLNWKWNISSPTCRTVASSPNIQVWGGHIGTNGTIKTGTTYKKGPSTSAADSEGASVNKYFGSWGEYAIVTGTNGKLHGIASGAALGYTVDGGYQNYVGHSNSFVPGGAGTAAYNYRAKLSVPNDNCQGSGCNAITTPAGVDNISSTVVDRIYKRYVTSSGHPNSNYCNENANCQVIETDHVSDAGPLGKGQTKIFFSRGNITISSNLLVDKGTGGAYSKASDVPNYLVIATGNINIEGGVTELDAWLVAKGTIDTCSNASKDRDAGVDICPVLTINGIVIANDMIADRASGGGAQEDTGTPNNFQDQSAGTTRNTYNYNTEPAELINYSAASYLWAYAQARKDTQAHTVYTRTLAPRL